MGLIVWLPLNGNLNNQGLKNITATTLETITYEKGKLGNAARIGTGSQVKNGISIDSNLVEDLGSEYSCSVWIKPTGNHVHYEGAILSSGDWNHTKWAFGVGQNNTTIDPFGPGYNYKLPCTIPTNEWTHLVSTVHNNIATVYKNGEQIGTHDFGNLVLDSDATNTTIGRETYANGYFGFNGCIEDVRIYNHCLSPREVKEISKGLVLHYPLAMPGQENLIEKSSDFTGWSINSIFTIDQISTGEYVASASRTGATSNMWSRIIPTVKLNPELYPNGVTVSFDFKCNDISALDHKCICALQIYNASNTRIGWYEAKNSFSEANYVGGTTLQNNKWKRLSCYFTQSNLKTVSSSGYTVNDISYTMLSFQLVKNGSISFKNIKLECGSIATPWIPNSADTAYTTLGFNDGIEYDVSGYNHNGTKYGTLTYSSDTPRYNTSAVFNGTDNCIQFPFNDFCVNGDVFTMNIWWKKTALGTKAYETLIGGPGGFEMDTRSGSAQYLSLYMASTRGGNVYPSFNMNEWYMVTLVNDGTNELYYVNGVLVKTIEKKNMPSGNYYVGAWKNETGQNFNGFMSDFRFYKTALSADDILELYHTPISLSNNGTLLTQGEYVES